MRTTVRKKNNKHVIAGWIDNLGFRFTVLGASCLLPTHTGRDGVRNMWQGGEKTQPAVDEGLDSRPIEALVAHLRTMEMDGRQVSLVICFLAVICFYRPGQCTETSTGACMCGLCVYLSTLDENFTLNESLDAHFPQLIWFFRVLMKSQ